MSNTAVAEPPTEHREALALIDDLLAQQRELSAVETFARRHDEHDLPAQSKYYRDLLPASLPDAGQQYAFEVDLDACSGCKACVTACHNLNGLDDNEAWRDVGLLVADAAARQSSASLPILQHITSACHHCLEPACMDGCPVLAYEKDPITGVVRHLDDQCIGCQYCILKCPYDVPKYNARLGIVRKCDMCSSRLAQDEAPACVQGCPNGAIRITIVDRQQVRDDAEANRFLPGAHEPDYTLPTTRFKSRHPIPHDALPADHYRVAPEHAHWPLVIMLVLTQLSVGAFAIGQVLAWRTDPAALTSLRPVHAAVALALGVIALGASTLHLGRPLYAYRAILGLRTSWLSREIVTFGGFAKLAAAYAAILWLQPSFVTPRMVNWLGTAVAGSGAVGVFCSVMIYHDTRRPFWRFRYTATKFALSTVLLGTATTLLTSAATAFCGRTGAAAIFAHWAGPACAILVSVSLLKLALALLTFLHLRDPANTPMKRTARLAAGPLLQPVVIRLLMGFVGGVMVPLLLWGSTAAPRGRVQSDVLILSAAIFTLTLASDLLERYLFFTAVVAPKMPGGIGK